MTGSHLGRPRARRPRAGRPRAGRPRAGRPWLRGYYPLLFAALPALHVAASNPGEYALDDLGRVAAALVLAALALLVVARLLLPRASASLVVMLVVAGFFAYQSVYGYARLVLAPGPAHAVLLGGGVAASVGLVVWLRRRPHALDRLATLLAATGSLLVVWALIGIASDQVRGRKALARSPLVRELAQPVPVERAPAAGPRRDVYLILVDEYGNDAVLREFYGFDNREFLDSLRALGFTIPREVHSNYTYTTLSLPSLTNFAHLHSLAGAPGGIDPSLPDYLQAHSRAAAFLKARGYRFILFPSQWWGSTRKSPLADATVDVWPGFDLGRALTRSELRRTLRFKSPLALSRLGDHAEGADFVRRTLRGVGDSAAAPGPKFVLAHLLNPHAPFVFDRDCRTAPEYPGGAAPDRRFRYVEQVRCLNGLLLETVDRILEASPVAPIIVLQGDHGPDVLGFDEAPSPDQISAEQARERLGAFGAYYLPDGGGRGFRGSITLVNVFPKIFNHYFGTELPLSPDHLYLSVTALGPQRLVDTSSLAGR